MDKECPPEGPDPGAFLPVSRRGGWPTTGRPSVARPWIPSIAREKLTGVAAARAAADNLVRRLERELRQARATIGSLSSQLEFGSGGDGAEVEAPRREASARPALVERARGRREAQGLRLRRNVAWHAERCPAADAPPREWRRAERGPRLPGGPPPVAKAAAKAQARAKAQVPTGATEQHPGLPRMPPTMPIIDRSSSALPGLCMITATVGRYDRRLSQARVWETTHTVGLRVSLIWPATSFQFLF
mgnify:CR=1 FL=1